MASAAAQQLGAEFFSKVPIEVQRKVSSELDRVRSFRQEQAVVHRAETRLVQTQLKEIQQLQKEEETLVAVVRQKHIAELAVIKTAETREQEAAWKMQERELERLLSKNAAQLDAFVRSEAADEKKVSKSIRDRLLSEIASYQDQLKKERKHHKEEVRSTLSASGETKDNIKHKLKDLKEEELAKIARAGDVFVVEQENRSGEELKSFKITKTTARHALQVQLLEEVG